MGKTTKRVLIAGLIILGLAVFCMKGAALAQDYHWKFMVPVELKNMHPDAKMFKIIVIVNDSAKEQVAGQSSSQIPIPADGNYSGVVEVKVKALPGKDPSAGATYSVSLAVNDKQIFNVATDPIWAKPKPGAEFTGFVIGTIPQ